MFEVSPGNTSSARIYSFIALLAISIPGSWLILIEIVKNAHGELTWQKMILLLTTLIIINLLWIAPKQLAKMTEEKGLIAKIINKK